MKISIRISETDLALLRAQARHWVVTGHTAPVTEIIRRLIAAAPKPRPTKSAS